MNWQRKGNFGVSLDWSLSFVNIRPMVDQYVVLMYN